MLNLKSDLRALLLTIPAVTDLIDDRIRPDGPDETDGLQDLLIIEVPDADQFNTLDRTAAGVNADVLIRCRSQSQIISAAIQEAVRSGGTDPLTGLDGYSGAAGDGTIIASERQSYASGRTHNDDGSDEHNYETTALYSIWYSATSQVV